MRSEIAQAVDALIKSGKINEGDGGVVLPNFNLIDIYPIFKHSFSPKAQATMDNKTMHQVYQYNVVGHGGMLTLLGRLGLVTCAMYKEQDSSQIYFRKADLVNYVAIRATKDKLPLAIEKVINTVNEVADKGFTKASLVQLGVLELHPIDLPEPEYAVISYITLTRKGIDYVDQNPSLKEMFIDEGGMPVRLT